MGLSLWREDLAPLKQVKPVSEGFVSLISTTGSGLLLLLPAVPDVSGRSLLHNGLLLRNEPPPLRRQTRRINCKDNCVSCGFRKPAAGTSNCHCGCQAVKGRESPGTAFLLSILYSS